MLNLVKIGQKWLMNIGQIVAFVTIGLGHKMVVLDFL